MDQEIPHILVVGEGRVGTIVAIRVHHRECRSVVPVIEVACHAGRVIAEAGLVVKGQPVGEAQGDRGLLRAILADRVVYMVGKSSASSSVIQ